MIPFVWNISNRQIHRDRKLFPGVVEREKWGVIVNGHWVSIGDDKNTLELDSGGGCTTLWI